MVARLVFQDWRRSWRGGGGLHREISPILFHDDMEEVCSAEAKGADADASRGPLRPRLRSRLNLERNFIKRNV